MGCGKSTPIGDDRMNVIYYRNQIKQWENEAMTYYIKEKSSRGSDSSSSSRDGSAGQYNQQGYSGRILPQNGQQTKTTFEDEHLFECLFLVGLNLKNSNKIEPYIEMKYPNHVDVSQLKLNMCFPDAHYWHERSSEKRSDKDLERDRCYVITLTDEAGVRKYAYCRRIKAGGESFTLQFMYCILSSRKTNEFYFLILEQVEKLHGQSDVDFQKLAKMLHETRFPLKGQGIKIAAFPEKTKDEKRDDYFLSMESSDPRLRDLKFTKLLACMQITDGLEGTDHVFFSPFISLLLERKVILFSSSISKLSTCIQGLQVAIFPRTWQHTLITVVPPNAISVPNLCKSPKPYVIGLLKPGNNPRDVLSALDDEVQVLAIDLDERTILREVGDEDSILSSDSVDILRTLLILHGEPVLGPYLCTMQI